jgi:cytochrome c
MKAANVDWDAEHLNTYLTDPHAMVPSTRMIFPGLKDETDRQNLIAYLATLK